MREGRQEAGAIPDAALIKAAVRAHVWFEELANVGTTLAKLARREGMTGSSLGRILPLAFLAPELVEAIIDGRQMRAVSAQDIIRNIRIPLEWRQQRSLLSEGKGHTFESCRARQ